METEASGPVSRIAEFGAGNYVVVYSIEDDDVVMIHYVFRGSQDIESFFPQ